MKWTALGPSGSEKSPCSKSSLRARRTDSCGKETVARSRRRSGRFCASSSTRSTSSGPTPIQSKSARRTCGWKKNEYGAVRTRDRAASFFAVSYGQRFSDRQVLLELRIRGGLAREPLDQVLDVRLQYPGIEGAAIEVRQVDRGRLGKLRRGDDGEIPLERSVGRALAIRAELPMLLRRRAGHLPDVLEQETAPAAALEARREDGMLEPVRDRPDLAQDLQLLGRAADEVQDAMVRGFGVGDQRGQHRDGLPEPAGCVQEQGPAGPAEQRHGGHDPLLTRSGAVREQRRDRRLERRGHDRPGPRDRRKKRDLKVSLQ